MRTRPTKLIPSNSPILSLLIKSGYNKLDEVEIRMDKGIRKFTLLEIPSYFIAGGSHELETKNK